MKRLHQIKITIIITIYILYILYILYIYYIYIYIYICVYTNIYVYEHLCASVYKVYTHFKLLYIYCSALHQGVLLLNENPMLIFVPCRFRYQFISIYSSIFLFLFFCYLINYILLLYYYTYNNVTIVNSLLTICAGDNSIKVRCVVIHHSHSHTRTRGRAHTHAHISVFLVNL